MAGTLQVTGGQGGEETTSSAHEGHGMSAKQMALHDAKVTGSFPADTTSVGGQELKPEIIDSVKVFELTPDQLEWEVSPGEIKQAYAYNGMVPGPDDPGWPRRPRPHRAAQQTVGADHDPFPRHDRPGGHGWRARSEPGRGLTWRDLQL